MKRLALALALAMCSFAAAAAVNLNTATKDELVALPGIGPAKAQAILDYRSKNGAFKSIEELKDVKGIGAKRYEQIKGDLTVVAQPPNASAKAAAAKPADASPSKAADASSPQRMAKGAVTTGAKRDDPPNVKP
jgi:competence protein ComEA